VAALLDEPAVRAAGLGGLARLTHTVAGAADPLALRAGQAGMPWSQVRQLIPRVGHLGALSARLHQACSPHPSAAAQLENLELARPPIRTDTPSHELADRLVRMHRGAWELARTPQVGVASLLDYAALGVMLHGHTAAALAAHVPATPSGIHHRDSEAALRRVKQGGAAWQAVHLRLRDLRTATPGSLALRGDLHRVRHLLRALVPLGARLAPDIAAAPDRAVLATLVGGLRSFDDIAAWNAHVLDDLAARGQLFLSATAPTGSEVADRDDLIEAKLTHRVARVPPKRIDLLRDAYQALRGANAGAAPSATVHLLAETRPAGPQPPRLEP
jgi:hypothetical protein